MIRKIDHVGVAARNRAALGALYEKLFGFQLESQDEIPEQKVRTAFYPCADVRLEILESTAPDGPVGRFLEKRGEGFHHIAFEVDDIESELGRLKGLGVQLIDERPRRGAHGTRIAFLHPKSTGGLLVELVERPRA